MAYLIFFAKRALKNSLTLVTVGVTLILIMIMLAMNIKTYKSVSLNANAQQNLDASYLLKKLATQDLSKYEKGTDRYEAAVANYSDANKGINENSKLIDDLKDGNYIQAYKIALRQNNSALKLSLKDKSSTPELLTALKRENLRLKELEKGRFKEQSEDYPVDALGFLTNCLRYVLPVLFTVIIVFVLSQTMAERFSNKLSIGDLFPFQHSSISISDTSAGIVISIGIVIFISVFIFIISGMISGFGHWNYPMFTYVSPTSKMRFISTGTVLLRTVPLSLLFLIFTVVVCNFISVLTKNKLVSLFASIVVLVALPLTTWLVIPMQSIAHYLPTTYLFSELTVTGELAKTFDNYNITANLGLIVVICSILLILAGTWIVERSENK